MPDPRPVRCASARPRHSAFMLICSLVVACAPAATTAPPTPQELPALEAQLAQDSANVGTLLRVAAGYRATSRVAESRPLLERAVALEPDRAEGILLLGLTYEELGEAARARELYQRYIEVAPASNLKSELEERLQMLERQALLEAVRGALSREQALAQTEPEPAHIAVFPFTYVGENAELRPLGRALAELLVTDLAQVERLTVLERTRVQLLLDELALSQAGYTEPATAARSGRLLGAGRIVQGSLGGSQNELRLQAAVVGIGGDWDGRVESISRESQLDEVLDMEENLAFDILRSLQIELTPAERARIRERPTENLQALLQFGLGLEAEDAGDFDAAAGYFQSASQLDPQFGGARVRAQTARQTARARTTTTRQIAQRAAAERAGSALQLRGAESIVPGIGRRDAAAEVLGQEGVGARSAVLEIRIRIR